MLYFAYGSNLNRQQFEIRCPGSTPVDVAELRGYRLAFRGNGHADIIREKGGNVSGALYRVAPGDVEMLDRYEGVPIYYHRIKVVVRAGDGKTYQALAYKMNADLEDRSPTLAYILTIVLGCRDWGIDPDTVVLEALDTAQEGETETEEGDELDWWDPEDDDE